MTIGVRLSALFLTVIINSVRVECLMMRCGFSVCVCYELPCNYPRRVN